MNPDYSYIDTLRSGSLDREYHENMSRILMDAHRLVPQLQSDMTTEALETAALALLWYLQHEPLEIGPVHTDSHPCAGSLEEDAILVAGLFGSCGIKADELKAAYRWSMPDKLSKSALNIWHRFFSTHPAVKTAKSP